MVTLNVVNHDIEVVLPLTPDDMQEWTYWDDDSDDECIFNWEGSAPPVCPTGGEPRVTFLTIRWEMVDKWYAGQVSQCDDQFVKVLTILKCREKTIGDKLLSW